MTGLTELARFPVRIDADLARLRLEAEGIGAVLFDEGMNYIGLGPAMPVRLMVLEEDLEEAAKILGRGNSV